MTQKPYVPHYGIKHNQIAATLTAGTVTVTEYTEVRTQSKRCVKVDLSGKTGYVDLDAHPEIDELLKIENARYEQEFVNRYPGIYELVTAQNDEDFRYERLQREIESGNGILSDSTPENDPAEVARQYPIAAAYLTICGYLESNNLNKYGAGKWAIEQIENGADVIETRNQMQDRWHEAARNAID